MLYLATHAGCIGCEPDCRLFVSIEREDANADPHHPGNCGARARRLQCQSGGQYVVADGPEVFAGHYSDNNPYNPISYAQNNTGRGGR